MTITRQALAQLEARRPTMNLEKHYTIDGPVEAAVHSNVESERIGRLNRGHRTLNNASTDLQTNLALNANRGLPTAQFGQAAPSTTPTHTPDFEALKVKTQRQMAREQTQERRHTQDMGQQHELGQEQ
ncbi:MAG: hypothetical protein RIC85_03085 [Gammaproteobacteria bacterium]